MKIELIKYTKEITGDVYYYTQVNGSMVQGTFTSDIQVANEKYAESLEKAKIYPVNVIETLKSEEL